MGAATEMRNPNADEINTGLHDLPEYQTESADCPVSPATAVYFITHTAVSLDAFQ